MKSVSRPSFTAVLLAFSALVVVSHRSHAEDIIISQFNDANSLNGWRFDFGGVSRTIEFDATQDANNNAASGALKVTFGFDAALGGNNKGAVTLDFPTGLDGLSYVTMEMDLRVDTSSVTDGSGNSGYFQMVIRNGNGYAYNSQFGGDVRTNTAWRHISANVTGGRDNIRAITLELGSGAGLTGPVVFYVDNIKFTKPTLSRDVAVSRFDDASSLDHWRFDYGGVTNLIQFDSTRDASNDVASGSMRVTFGFDAALDVTGNNKGALTLDLPTPIDASSYQTLEMDVKVDAASATDSSGNSGSFQLVVRYGGFYDWNPQFNADLRIGDGWRHIRVAPPVPPVNDIYAFTMELYGGAGLTGPVIFNIDNLKFTTTNVAPPQPKLSIEHPHRGLNLIPTSGQYQRQNIVSATSPGYSWIGMLEPVTYSLTIDKHPDASHTGFQTHMFLVPGAPTDSSPDYSQPNVIFLDIQSQGGGAAYAQFRYKVNEPSGNAFLYGAGTLGGVGSASPIGTWSLTFSNDTDLTLTAPGGASANFSLPPAAAALFANPVAVWVGAQPNSGGNIGQGVVLANVGVQRGDVVLLADNFLADETLDAQKWQVYAGDPIGVRLVGSDGAFWLSWTIPDSGFVLQQTSNLEDPNSWIATGGTAPLIGNNKKIFVHKYNDNQLVGEFYAPPNPHAFYRLIHP